MNPSAQKLIDVVALEVPSAPKADVWYTATSETITWATDEYKSVEIEFCGDEISYLDVRGAVDGWSFCIQPHASDVIGSVREVFG